MVKKDGEERCQIKPVYASDIYVETKGKLGINWAESWGESMLAIANSMFKVLQFGTELKWYWVTHESQCGYGAGSRKKEIRLTRKTAINDILDFILRTKGTSWSSNLKLQDLVDWEVGNHKTGNADITWFKINALIQVKIMSRVT